ncbi:unnamed protein product [Symbiodinium necroappetens]|uniref:Uncharacterized protein n=1 Tax=Symbiodinium necroappetens TaxID=1628268 RepID=A0A813B1Z7_9DINO|nr:unnamed protein product [Symbiodinium necroappetens]
MVGKQPSTLLCPQERVFDSDGNFLREEWEDYDGKEDLCQIGMSSPLFYFTVVFLWVLLIVRELRTTERLARDIWSMPSCRTSAAMTGEDSDHHVVQVVALTPCVRTLIYFMVILPKLVICCTLMYLGCQWLTATNSFADLVMNSIAMEFVAAPVLRTYLRMFRCFNAAGLHMSHMSH